MKPLANKWTYFAGCALALGMGTASAQQMVSARVLSSNPVWAAVPVQNCARGGYSATSGVGAVVGAVIGGVVGNAFGHGDGRALATAAGVLGGAALGNTAEAQQRYAGGCATHYENRVTGYDVSYELGGQVYQIRTAGDPGGWIQVPAPVDAAYQGGYGGGYGAPGAQSYPVAPPPMAPSYPLAGNYPDPRPVVTAPVYVQPYPAYYPPAQPPVVYAPAPVAHPVYAAPPMYVNPVGVTLSVGGVIGGHRGGRVGWGIGF